MIGGHAKKNIKKNLFHDNPVTQELNNEQVANNKLKRLRPRDGR